MTPRQKRNSSTVRTFGAPAIIAVVSLVGIFAALLGADMFDLASWIGLGVPVAVIVWAMITRRS